MIRALNSRNKQLAAGTISLILAYILASVAIDTGRWLIYFLTFAMLCVGAKLFLQGFRNHDRG